MLFCRSASWDVITAAAITRELRTTTTGPPDVPSPARSSAETTDAIHRLAYGTSRGATRRNDLVTDGQLASVTIPLYDVRDYACAQCWVQACCTIARWTTQATATSDSTIIGSQNLCAFFVKVAYFLRSAYIPPFWDWLYRLKWSKPVAADRAIGRLIKPHVTSAALSKWCATVWCHCDL